MTKHCGFTIYLIHPTTKRGPKARQKPLGINGSDRKPITGKMFETMKGKNGQDAVNPL
jgi:hypothetical protein